MKTIIALLALALGLLPQLVDAASWWNGDWKFRKEIGFDLSPTGADIAGTPQDVPVLVRFVARELQAISTTPGPTVRTSGC